MSYGETSVTEAEEAEGVARIEMATPPLSGEDAKPLDQETLGGLDEQERKELEEAAAKAGSGAKAAGSLALSQSFVLAEFHCCRGHCAAASVPSNAVPALRRLVTQVLQPMRDRFGQCTVHSGYRNAQHNRHVGGVDDSCHRYDVRPTTPAADVSFATGGVDEWAAEARRRLPNIGGIGRYPSSRFVHVDLNGFRAWTG
jgi:Peptidase M15